VIGLKRQRLLRAIAKGDESARWEASRQLSHDDDPVILRKLQRVLERGDSEEARGAAAYVLGFCGQVELAPALARVLSDRTESATVRAYAAEALGHLLQGADLVLAEVRAAILAGLRGPEPQVRFWSAFAAGVLGLQETRTHLVYLADTDGAEIDGWWSVAEEAEWALRVLNGEEDPPLPNRLA
jgi:HEAT repeat protein